MKTVTINTAGKRKSAYITTEVPTSLNLSGRVRESISVKKANELIGNLPIYHSGVNYKTYKI